MKPSFFISNCRKNKNISKLNYQKSDTIIISDLHIGSEESKTGKLYEFLCLLLENPPKRLVIAGDVFELWSTNYKKIGEAEYKCIRKAIELSQNGVKLVYIPGNHDRAIRGFRKLTVGKIKIRNEYTIKYDKKRYIVMHGDEFDIFTRNHVILSLIAGKLYTLLVRWSAFTKRFFGFRASLATMKNSKRYMKTVKKIKKAALAYARSQKADGIIIGHSHYPEIFENSDGITYVNSGDWIDGMTYAVAGDDLKLEYFR